MDCVHKEIHGSCTHHQCEFASETAHGYECVDIHCFKQNSFCEVGEGCLEKCSHSWQPGTDKALIAKEWLDEISEELKQYENEFLSQQAKLQTQ